jgi:hypothetical protein
VSTSSDPTQIVIEQSLASGRGAHDALKQLDSLGIEWFVTDQGDLMTKTWRVVAARFVAPQDVPLIRQSHPPEADALNWVSQHLADLRARFAGRWIAVEGGAVVADASTFPRLMKLLSKRAAGAKPLITQITAEEPSWIVTYASHH